MTEVHVLLALTSLIIKTHFVLINSCTFTETSCIVFFPHRAGGMIFTQLIYFLQNDETFIWSYKEK